MLGQCGGDRDLRAPVVAHADVVKALAAVRAEGRLAGSELCANRCQRNEEWGGALLAVDRDRAVANAAGALNKNLMVTDSFGPRRVALVATRHEVVGRVVLPVAIEMISNERVARRDRAGRPANLSPAPVTGVRPYADALEQPQPVNGNALALGSEEPVFGEFGPLVFGASQCGRHAMSLIRAFVRAEPLSCAARLRRIFRSEVAGARRANHHRQVSITSPVNGRRLRSIEA